MKSRVFCIVCEKALENLIAEKGFQPSGGLEFVARGHYGSALLDPLSEEESRTRLVICVCDECLKAAAQKEMVGVYHIEPGRPSPPHVWKPE